MDLTKVKDPFPYMNVVIGQINDQKPEDALALIGKLMIQFPTDTVALLLPRARQPRGEEAARKPSGSREVRRGCRRRRGDARREEDSRADEGHQVKAALCALLLLSSIACGGGEDGSELAPRHQARQLRDPAPPSAPKSSKPDVRDAIAVPSSKIGQIDPSPRWRVLESLWIHQQTADRRRRDSHARAPCRHVV